MYILLFDLLRYLTKAQSFTAREKLLDIFNIASPFADREKVTERKDKKKNKRRERREEERRGEGDKVGGGMVEIVTSGE